MTKRLAFTLGFLPGVLKVSKDGKYLIPPIGPSFHIDPMNRLIEIETTELKPMETPERGYAILGMDMLGGTPVK